MRLLAVLSGLALAGPALASDVFYADADLTPVTVDEDEIGLLLNGEVRAWKTGNLAVKVDNPAIADALESWPEIAYLEAIREDRGIYKIVGERGIDEFGLSRRITAIPGVVFCHPDLEYELVPHTLDDPLLDVSWHIDNDGSRGGLAGVDSGAFEAWETTMGEGQIIAIVDTGVDLAQPDLDLLPGFDFGGQDDDPTPDPDYDGYAHGTAMAGVAASIGDNGIGTAGIAPKAQILPIKLLGNEGTSDFTVYESWTWAADQGATVISNSWGRGSDCPRVAFSGVLQDAVAYLEEEGRGGRGTAITMSMGNSGCDNRDDNFHNDPYMISVGAATDTDERASYSNYGPGLHIMGFGAGNGRPGLWTTDITGELGYNDGDFHGGASGTSSACASVSGVLALMFAANERLTASEARDVLCDTAVKSGDPEAVWDAEGRSDLYGCGRIDAGAAVAVVANSGPPSVTVEDPGPMTTDVARLAWTGTDPDDEHIRYRVQVWFEGQEDEPIIDEILREGGIVLDDQLFAATIPYGWSVTPIDAWGEGETVLGPDFTVSPPEQVKGSCSSVPVSGLGWLGALGLLGLAFTRRREGACAR